MQKLYYSICKNGKGIRVTVLSLLSLCLFLSTTTAQAPVKGTVKDATTEEPLIGVNVKVKGTDKGTVTDVEGNFQIDDIKEDDVLIISYIGYEGLEEQVGNRELVNLTLNEGVSLDEITVTALGIKRETKALGYATQEVNGDEISVVKTPNLLNNLSGKLAGVNITQGGSGVGSSSRMVIRGESSLSGDNQPLFVVNGVPINNSNGSNGRSQGNLEADYGNGAAEISPDDIETLTVLRGANATALYGSRAANGVVLITTKTGRGTDGLGVSFSSATTFERPLRIPEYQNKYGQGAGFNFEFVDGFGAGTNDNIDESWGLP